MNRFLELCERVKRDRRDNEAEEWDCEVAGEVAMEDPFDVRLMDPDDAEHASDSSEGKSDSKGRRRRKRRQDFVFEKHKFVFERHIYVFYKLFV